LAAAFAPSTVSQTSQFDRLEKQLHNRASGLLSDTVAGAKASAMIDSLMLTCRACNVESYAYLVHLLPELPKREPRADVTDLLPFNYAKPTETATR
jgi:transposase